MPLPTPTQSPTLAQLVLDAIESALYRLRVAQPGRVQSFDAGTNTVSVQPEIHDGDYNEDRERISKPLALVQGVPVVFLGGTKDWWMSHPISPGDTGLLIQCSSSTDRWKAARTEGAIDPGDDRRHNLSDSIFLPGLRQMVASLNVPLDAWVINGAKILLGSPNANDPVARMSDLNALIDKYLLHVHPAPGGTTSATVNGAFTIPPRPTGSPVVKLD